MSFLVRAASGPELYPYRFQVVADAMGTDAVLRGNRGEGLTGPVEFGRLLGLARAESWRLGVDAMGAEMVTDRVSVNAEFSCEVVDSGARFVVGNQSVDFGGMKLAGCTQWNTRSLRRVRCA